MNKTIKYAIITILIILGGILAYSFAVELNEKPPGHPLDYQIIDDIIIDEPINSIEDALMHATIKAKEWREDAILIEMSVKAPYKEEWTKVWFDYVSIAPEKPYGFYTISINKKTNSIEFISANYDDVLQREFKELNSVHLTENINTLFHKAIEEIEEDILSQYDEPIMRLHIHEDYATFELFSSNLVKYPTLYSIRINFETDEIHVEKTTNN